ncbi:MAG: phosphoribosylanthranilate isomerase [Cyclobacteriaceae bacterium]|nr:phosphoribosylanthranilate isomerase [Cyclobacteriaceae bacterium]
MALKTFVKISKVNNLSDARYCAGMGVDVMGFSLDPSREDFVDPEKFSAISSWLAGVLLAGEFEECDANDIIKSCELYELDYIQVNNPALLPELRDLNKSLILKIDIEGFNDIENARAMMERNTMPVEFYLLESESDPDDQTLLHFITELAAEFPLVLGFGIRKENIAFIMQSHLKGIALKGGNEVKPGFKDFDELADILELLEEN